MKNNLKNEDNLINQMLKDENIPEKKDWLGYMKDIYDIYINTLNNEENQFQNIENEKLINEGIFKASDFPLLINDEDHLEIGHCIRETFFRYKNSYSDYIKSSSKEETEKNILVKEQLLRKLRLCSLIKEDINEIVNYCDLNIETTTDGLIFDYEKDKEYLLFIKPVNDYSTIIKNKVFNLYKEKTPLNFHLPEIILNMVLLKKPAKVLYVGKINSDNIVEFNFGINNGRLTINGIEKEEIKTNYIISQIKGFSIHKEKDVVPRKIFTDVNLYNDQINEMIQYGLIEDFEVNKLLNGEMYVNFMCKNCPYLNICKEN